MSKKILPFLKNKLNHRVFSKENVLNLYIESGEQIGFITPPCQKILQKFPKFFKFQNDHVVFYGKCFQSRNEIAADFAKKGFRLQHFVFDFAFKNIVFYKKKKLTFRLFRTISKNIN
jgi:hypothetical protein